MIIVVNRVIQQYIGSFDFTVQATDTLSETESRPLAVTVVASNLVLNAGFETGDFTDWTTSGNFTSCFVDEAYAHSVQYGAQLGPAETLGYLSQTLATTSGAAYLISVWLENPDGGAGNEFLVSWDGASLYNQSNMAATDWTNLRFIVLATGFSTLLELGFRNDFSYFGLDDVSVTAISMPRVTLELPSLGVGRTNFVFQLSGPVGANYVLQVSTNLVNWLPVRSSTIPVSGLVNFTNGIGGNSRQFYRVAPQGPGSGVAKKPSSNIQRTSKCQTLPRRLVFEV